MSTSGSSRNGKKNTDFAHLVSAKDCQTPDKQDTCI